MAEAIEVSGQSDMEQSRNTYSDIIQTIEYLDPKNAEEIFGKPYVVIVEQPQQRAGGYKFRYLSDKRSEPIPGANSTPKSPTYVTIQIKGYKGPAKVVASFVTIYPPHMPHPHNLLGLNCDDGVCLKDFNPDTMTAIFERVGIQCTKREDIKEALNIRKKNKVDPFRTGFRHRYSPTSIELNAVRLCFQVFLPRTNQSGEMVFDRPLAPIVSDIIYDRKGVIDLGITKLSKPSSSVAGGEEIIILCKKLPKGKFRIRIFGKSDGKTWEIFVPSSDIELHERSAFIFRTPPYRSTDIVNAVNCFIQIQRTSDDMTGEPRPFEYVPIFKEKCGGKRPKVELQSFVRDQVLNESHLYQPPLTTSPQMTNETRHRLQSLQNDSASTALTYQHSLSTDPAFIPTHHIETPMYAQSHLDSPPQQMKFEQLMSPMSNYDANAGVLSPATPYDTNNFQNLTSTFNYQMLDLDTQRTTNEPQFLQHRSQTAFFPESQQMTIPSPLAHIEPQHFPVISPQMDFGDANDVDNIDLNIPLQVEAYSAYSSSMLACPDPLVADGEVAEYLQSMSLEEIPCD